DVAEIHASASQLSPEVIRSLAGEFKGIMADYLLLEAATVIGAQNKLNVEDWNAISRLFKQSMALDPYFKQTYSLVQSTLPWEAKMPEKAIELLKISSLHRSWDWQPDFYIGFDYYYHFNDNLNGSKYLMEASKNPGASPLLGLLGAHLSQKGGQTKAGIAFLRTMYENEENEDTKKQIKQRMDALEGVLILEEAIEKFTVKFDRSPKNLDELITAEILSAIPKNPYYDAYYYDHKTGIISYNTAF
ncbi:MAG: hypothetical protein DRH93_12735, partial [Deltaproteobacteria bacterium]